MPYNHADDEPDRGVYDSFLETVCPILFLVSHQSISIGSMEPPSMSEMSAVPTI